MHVRTHASARTHLHTTKLVLFTGDFVICIGKLTKLSSAINLGQMDDIDAISWCEPTPFLTKSSVTNFKLALRFT